LLAFFAETFRLAVHNRIDALHSQGEQVVVMRVEAFVWLFVKQCECGDQTSL
jgi:predicted Mrr-cat superfamily restriction endonuclease